MTSRLELGGDKIQWKTIHKPNQNTKDNDRNAIMKVHRAFWVYYIMFLLKLILKVAKTIKCTNWATLHELPQAYSMCEGIS